MFKIDANIESPDIKELEPPSMFALIFKGRSKMFYLKEGTIESEQLSIEMFQMVFDLT